MASEEILEGGGRNAVVRIGAVVHRPTGPWARTVQALLRHFEAVGFAGAPRVVGDGFDAQGRETLSYIAGAIPVLGKWAPEAMADVGMLLRASHDAATSFVPPDGAVWRPWFGRALGDGARIVGHCDTGPWNIIERDRRPVALIDWEEAGPVDPMVDLAQTCWLNAQLHDDDIVERTGLPDAAQRARDLRSIADGYGATKTQRETLVMSMIEFAIHAAADEARTEKVTPDSTNITPLWAVAWRSRSASWMLSNRALLENALS